MLLALRNVNFRVPAVADFVMCTVDFNIHIPCFLKPHIVWTVICESGPQVQRQSSWSELRTVSCFVKHWSREIDVLYAVDLN